MTLTTVPHHTPEPDDPAHEDPAHEDPAHDNPAHDKLRICAWPDPVIDTLGHDPRSAYVETYWLGILGPSTTWLARRLVAGLEAEPKGYELDLAECARCLGLGDRGGRHSPFRRALVRLTQFELAQSRGPETLAVRRRIPPINRHQAARLPDSLRATHDALVESEARMPAAEHLRRRSRQLALSLIELGEDLEATERQLVRWRFHPVVAREASVWAWDRHRGALITPT
ncbi:MAG: hypothetical protein ACRDX8_11035 [Acidimicrobiales bacterium]